MPVYPWTLFSSLILCFSILFHFPFTPLAVNQQGEALLSWKGTWKGAFHELSNWNSSDETPCGWFGVLCNFNNDVVELNLRYVDLFGNVPSNFTSLLTLNKFVLSGANLTGSIPKEIASLTQLNYLDLSENALTGEIPIQIGNLTSLKQLILYDNQLSDGIPSSIGKLKNLEAIRAGGNKNLGGSLPEEIGNCTNLVMIGLAETSISGFLPPSLGLLKKLQTIAIYTALLSGQIPPEIGDCTELQYLYLYENSLTGSIPSKLGNLKNLVSLFLWQNNLVGVIPPELGNCNQLVIIDVSMNSLTGSMPQSFGNLTELQELQLSVNQLSGEIPAQIGNCQKLTHIELDNNQITGAIPSELGNLSNLTLLFLWRNKLEGGIFQLKKLNKLLLLSNNLSGVITSEIGNCSSLIRFRASNNKLTGFIPPETGNLKNLNFLDLGWNRLTGKIPGELSGCGNLTFLDLHSNSIAGNLPTSLSQLVSLQFVDFSDNLIEGTLSPNLGSLSSLTKLVLSKNRLSGSIPSQLGSCVKLQLLDLGSNRLSGSIPASLGKIPALEIALNLSCNQLSGKIPSELAGLDKLGVLDISHNQLTGDLHFLAELENLVVLNVSHNTLSGRVPDTPFFAKLPLSVLAGNPALCFSGNQCADSSSDRNGSASKHATAARVAMVVLLCAACALLLAALYIIMGPTLRGFVGSRDNDGDEDVELGPPWELTLYNKLDLSITDVVKSLTAGNIVGRGRTGVVYKVTLPSGLTVAVKRFRASDKISTGAFSSEIATLARIRHRNIVRLLGWGANRKTKLLFYDYMPNGTLGALLHDGECGGPLEWDTRFKIALGVAEGLSYLHHDCVPAILHRDVKVHNILLGERYESCLADFGLARLVEDDNGGSFSANPQFAGSYGYIAPDHLKSKKDPVEILDPKLQGYPDTQVQEMLQALGIALLCTSNRGEDRPTMKDVAGIIKGNSTRTSHRKRGPQAHQQCFKKDGSSSNIFSDPGAIVAGSRIFSLLSCLFIFFIS
ncbi:hypothetical protein Patl1_18088 [Pistacia atlantica]|uniref:Uncharacterized protein n=1 Tax=Pistacia atlantica TaxID=434234 RepID=A0ACC1C094_9ROSI|nr:hypothetical protein Patl1_18088 [Pistacia atlantica]